MKKWFLGLGLFVSFYVIFLLATLPINTALAWFKIPNNINLAQASGTIWNAKIKQINIRQNRSSTIQVNNIATNLSLVSLLMLEPSINLTFGGKAVEGPQGALTVSGLSDTLSISAAKIMLPASDIAQKLNLGIDVDAFGQLTLNLASYVMGKPFCSQVQGNIIWPKAALSAFNQTVELGTLKAKLSCEKGALMAEIDPKNNLGLSFTAYLRGRNRLSGNGFLTPGNKFPQALKEVLPFFGRADNKGRYRLRF